MLCIYCSQRVENDPTNLAEGLATENPLGSARFGLQKEHFQTLRELMRTAGIKTVGGSTRMPELIRMLRESYCIGELYSDGIPIVNGVPETVWKRKRKTTMYSALAGRRVDGSPLEPYPWNSHFYKTHEVGHIFLDIKKFADDLKEAHEFKTSEGYPEYPDYWRNDRWMKYVLTFWSTFRESLDHLPDGAVLKNSISKRTPFSFTTDATLRF
jgi:hypothetical protein